MSSLFIQLEGEVFDPHKMTNIDIHEGFGTSIKLLGGREVILKTSRVVVLEKIAKWERANAAHTSVSVSNGYVTLSGMA